MLAGASISLGVAIWSMHFVGMLRRRVPFPVDYWFSPRCFPFWSASWWWACGVFSATAGPLTGFRLMASATFMGLGIASMHYIGMMALHASAHMMHAPLLVAASVVIAIAASGLALRLAAGPGKPAAVSLGRGARHRHIGHAYTAMAGMTIFPHANSQSFAPVLSPDLLAIVVAVVAFVLSGLFLLVLVPDRSDKTPVFETAPVLQTVDAAPAASEPAEVLRRRGDGHLPVERDRATYLMPVDSVVAVRANAHYTHVFDGSTTYFCSLPIGDVEARLSDSRFVRIHRSHIINLDRVVALKNQGDNCHIELASTQEPYIVPVSRSRTAWIKSQFGLKSRHASERDSKSLILGFRARLKRFERSVSAVLRSHLLPQPLAATDGPVHGSTMLAQARRSLPRVALPFRTDRQSVAAGADILLTGGAPPHGIRPFRCSPLGPSDRTYKEQNKGIQALSSGNL